MLVEQFNSKGMIHTVGQTGLKLKKATEKLSTGYTINRAADNASGLAVSEKMRSLIRGLAMARHNSEDGINLIQVGEGALQEVHDMLQRIREMAVQSSNGTYLDEVDREGLQQELEAITYEVDRSAKTTHFNGIHLFQEDGLEDEVDLSGWDLGDYKNLYKALFGSVYLSETAETGTSQEEAPLIRELGTGNVYSTEEFALNSDPDKLRIVYEEVEYDFSTTQTPASGAPPVIESSAASAKGASQCQALANTLKTQIVPNVVNNILSKYSEAFGYLTGSSIGIGLHIYQDSSNTLASVALGASSSSAGVSLSYTLNVNVNSLQFNGDQLTDDSRKALESTIAHEMIHAFMDEATTSGMLGRDTSFNPATKFPMWFVEGMAQSASGPGNWVASFGLNSSSTNSDITNALNARPLSSSGSNTAAQYGTGYLAAMYLGYAAATKDGGSVDMSNPTAAANAISHGTAKFLHDIIEGDSLDNVIKKYTSFNGISDFENRFASDSGTVAFVKSLLPYCTNGYGGVISGDLSNNDPVPDGNLSVSLFELDTTTGKVKNEYPDGINVMSGGTANATGVKPIADPPVTLTYPDDLFTVTGGTKGVDWDFDNNTGTLKILTGTSMTISGGTATVNGAKHSGEIVVKDGIGNVNISIKDINIDQTTETDGTAGINVGSGNKVTLNIVQGTTDNTIKAGGKSAGIQVGTNTDLVINASSPNAVLNVTGGNHSSQGGAGIGTAYGQNCGTSSITVNGGKLNINGGNGSAAIGAAYSGSIGDLTVNGGKINATAGRHGAGIGGGWTSSSKVGNITITGGDITASGIEHGTGIGAGCQGSVGNITITGNTSGGTVVVAKGGDDGAAIGGSASGRVGDINIGDGTAGDDFLKVKANGGKNGSGIGTGSKLFSGAAAGGMINIKGGVIEATGSTDAAGIGSGKNGTNTGINITGGTITAIGGLTNGGGNLGGYTDTSRTPAPLTIAPGLSIQAGTAGEGLYNTTGAKLPDGTPIYAYKFSPDSLPSGVLPSGFTFPVTAKTTTGKSFTWDDPIQHETFGGKKNEMYFWMSGEDHILEITDANGEKATLDLQWYPDAGMWRIRDLQEAPPPAEKPTYSGETTDPSDPTKPEEEKVKKQPKGIILQIGARVGNILVVPQFYFSKKALKMEELDISTRDNANDTIEKVDTMIARVSEIRSKYGALQNDLEHTLNTIGYQEENLQAAESQIRDTDMATEYIKYIRESILMQSGQTVLAQANAKSDQVLSVLQSL